jgi:hypothetical protein
VQSHNPTYAGGISRRVSVSDWPQGKNMGPYQKKKYLRLKKGWGMAHGTEPFPSKHKVLMSSNTSIAKKKVYKLLDLCYSPLLQAPLPGKVQRCKKLQVKGRLIT